LEGDVIILSPKTVSFDHKRGISMLYFEHQDTPLPFYMRGAVCWPCVYKDNLVGCAYVAGYNLDDRCIYIFEEQVFGAVEHTTDSNERLYTPGLVRLLNRAWSLYLCNTFFVSASDPSLQRYQLQIQRNSLVAPKPVFVKLRRFKDPVCANIAEELVQRGLVKADARLKLREQFEEYAGQPDMVDPGPAVRALWYLLTGFVWMPYIDRGHRQDSFTSLPLDATPMQVQLQTPQLL
jgi:hypothetical protein